MKQVAPFRHRSHLCPLGQTSTFQTLMDGPIFSLWFMTLFIRLIRLKVAIVRMLQWPHTLDVMDVLILCWSSSSRQSSHLRQKGPTAAAGMPSVHQTNPIDRRIPTDSSSSSSFYFKKKKSRRWGTKLSEWADQQRPKVDKGREERAALRSIKSNSASIKGEEPFDRRQSREKGKMSVKKKNFSPVRNGRWWTSDWSLPALAVGGDLSALIHSGRWCGNRAGRLHPAAILWHVTRLRW